ncbi:unnamed protein product [Calypogeia fissa]
MAAPITTSRDFNVVYSMNRSIKPSDWVHEHRDNEFATFSRVNVRGCPIALFIDGACRGNGQPGARAAYGVYAAQNSRLNRYGVLPNWASHTNQAAEVYAAQEAMELIVDNPEWGLWRNGVVLITDSDYLFHSMTRYISNWIGNGFLDVNGRPVVNRTAMSQLHSSICVLGERGIKILFWRIDREHNKADHLANLALGPRRRHRDCATLGWIEIV